MRDELCGSRVSVEVGTDLTKQKLSSSARKRVDRTHLRDQSEAAVLGAFLLAFSLLPIRPGIRWRGGVLEEQVCVPL